MRLIQNKNGRFQYQRLTQARKANRITQAELADRINVTRQAISLYEKPEPLGSTPSPKILRALSRQLEVSEAYFYNPLRESEKQLESAINFRSLKAGLKKHRQQAIVYMQWLVSVADFLSNYLETQPVDIPDFNLEDFTKTTNDDIENTAQGVRKYFGLGNGPISNLTLLLENKGVLIGRIPLARELDALSAWYNGRPVILINSNATNARTRFDLAHELFHLVAHKYLDHNDLEDKEALKIIESQANYFAGVFIAPNNTFLAEIMSISLDRLAELKKRWGLSIQAIIIRLYDLHAISETQKTYLFMNVSKRGWKRKEPGDDVDVEKPVYLKKSLDFLKSNNILDEQEFIGQTKLPEVFIRQLLPIKKKASTSNVIDFKERN